MNTEMATQAGRPNRFIQNLQTFFLTPQALVVGLVFATDSILLSSWVAHIPYVKQKLLLSDAELGMVLFAMPAGLLVMNPFTGRIIARLGEARACFWSAIGLALALAIPVNAPTTLLLVVGLFLAGLSGALINVAVNTCATNVERAQGIAIMSSCHGMWSVGGLLGSGVAGVIIALHVSPRVHVVVVSLLMIGLTFAVQRLLTGIPSTSRLPTGEKAGSSFVMPNRDLLLMILIGLALAMGEGAALDWSAVYLRESVGVRAQVAALGFAAFSLTMTAFRFTGDAILPRIGGKRWLQIGAVVGSAGLLVAIALPYPATALLGFAILGVGCSLGAPVLYAAALRVPGIPPAAGLATFATFSFIGFMAGPPIVGFISEAFGLYIGLGFVAGVLLISAGLARMVNLF